MSKRIKLRDINNKLKQNDINRSDFNYEQINTTIALIAFLICKMDVNLNEIGMIRSQDLKPQIAIEIKDIVSFVIDSNSRLSIITPNNNPKSEAFMDKYRSLSLLQVATDQSI